VTFAVELGSGEAMGKVSKAKQEKKNQENEY